MAVNQTWDADGKLISSTPVADPVPIERPTIGDFSPREVFDAMGDALVKNNMFPRAVVNAWLLDVRSNLKRI